jgi:hypothetical protein
VTIQSAKPHELFRDILEVTYDDLTRRWFLEKDGVLMPGYIYLVGHPPTRKRVALFIHLDRVSMPEVLDVTEG